MQRGMILLMKLAKPIKAFRKIHDIKVIFPYSKHYHYPSIPIMPFLMLNYYHYFELILCVGCAFAFFWE